MKKHRDFVLISLMLFSIATTTRLHAKEIDFAALTLSSENAYFDEWEVTKNLTLTVFLKDEKDKKKTNEPIILTVKFINDVEYSESHITDSSGKAVFQLKNVPRESIRAKVQSFELTQEKLIETFERNSVMLVSPPFNPTKAYKDNLAQNQK